MTSTAQPGHSIDTTFKVSFIFLFNLNYHTIFSCHLCVPPGISKESGGLPRSKVIVWLPVHRPCLLGLLCFTSFFHRISKCKLKCDNTVCNNSIFQVTPVAPPSVALYHILSPELVKNLAQVCTDAQDQEENCCWCSELSVDSGHAVSVMSCDEQQGSLSTISTPPAMLSLTGQALLTIQDHPRGVCSAHDNDIAM